MLPRGRGDRTQQLLFGATGWLFADLLLGLAMIYLVANSVGQTVPPRPTPTVRTTPTRPPTPTPSPTPFICGIEQQPVTRTIDVADAVALREGSPDAQASFVQRVNDAYYDHVGRTAGLAELFGGSDLGDANLALADGLRLAGGGAQALQNLAHPTSIFRSDKTAYQEFFSGTIRGDQVQLVVFFFQTSTGSVCG